MAGRLFGADGGVISHEEKDVTPLSREEIIILSKMHEVAQKHRIELRCIMCGKSILGLNNDSQDKLSVACGCRELRYTPGR